jgi:hypothetical protein
MATVKVYGSAIQALDKTQNLNDGDVVYTLLIKGSSSYAFDHDDVYISDVIGPSTGSTDEYNGPGYIAGHTGSGRKLQTLAAPYGISRTSNIVKFDMVDVVWTQIGQALDTVKAALVCKRVSGSMSDSDIVIVYLDFGSSVPIEGDDFTIQWNVDGVFKHTIT